MSRLTGHALRVVRKCYHDAVRVEVAEAFNPDRKSVV